MSLRIATDSNADVPPELVARLNIGVVPALLVISGQSFRDGVDISRAEYYQRLPSLPDLPTTAAPSSAAFEAAYRAFEEADHIVSIHLASTLSAIHHTALLAARAFGARVTVVDSGQVSMGLGWQVLAAAETAATGGSLAEVLAAVASVRRRVRVFAVLDTLKFLRRGGRVSWLRAGVARCCKPSR